MAQDRNPYRCAQNHYCEEQYDGKNCPYDKDNFGGSDNGDKLLKAVNEYGKTSKSGLTSQEWALWYKAVAENKKLGYWAETTIDGKAVLKVENNGAHKIVITGGTFENPSVSAIYTFHDADEMNDAITELKELW